MKISGSTLRFMDMETGEIHDFAELQELTDIYTDDTGYVQAPPIDNMAYTFTLERIPLRSVMRLFGITNNSIRLHGGKVIRTVPKRFWK